MTTYTVSSNIGTSFRCGLNHVVLPQGTALVLAADVDAALAERDARLAALGRNEIVCNEILEIMNTYHEQEQSSYGVDTPGGLEHMGDVWKLFSQWERTLKKEQPS